MSTRSQDPAAVPLAGSSGLQQRRFTGRSADRAASPEGPCRALPPLPLGLVPGAEDASTPRVVDSWAREGGCRNRSLSRDPLFRTRRISSDPRVLLRA
ncbi:hypothetical protein MRX96_035289 [Rhipicephalus microplus]